jgi:ferredoxin-like protein FixX
MALFVEIQVDSKLARDPDGVKKLVETCPVDIFAAADDGSLQIIDENVDECTLCELCLAVGTPGQVSVLKLYDDRKPLKRSA